MKGFKSIPLKLKGTPVNATHSYGAVVEPITIKEPYKPDVKEFADTDEFTRYFRGNEDTFKEASDDPEKPAKFLTANKLNRTYKIPGYRIRIIRKGTDNEELTLVKDYTSKSPNDETSNEPTIDESSLNELSERVDKMETIIQRLADQIDNIEQFLVQLKR
jgi:hypothetical protein